MIHWLKIVARIMLSLTLDHSFTIQRARLWITQTFILLACSWLSGSKKGGNNMAITRYLSFVEEATHGTPVTTGGETIDPLSAEIEPSGDSTLIYEGASRLDKLVAPGPYINEGEISTAFDDKAFPWFIKWTLGGYEVTGSGPYTHRFYPSPRALMQPFTVRVDRKST